MALLEIDKSKCKQDGICAQECPFGLIVLPSKDTYPAIPRLAEAACIVCGHCVAVCPQGALNHARISMEKSPPISKELAISQEQSVQFLRSRRSTRRYKDKPVEKEVIQKLIETARYAPTAGNAQDIVWTVFTEKEVLRHLSQLVVEWMRHLNEQQPDKLSMTYLPSVLKAWDAGANPILWDAPVLVVASSSNTSDSLIADNGLVNLTIAMSYLELAALPLGLRTCWAGIFQAALRKWEQLKTALSLPEGHINHYPMMLGYPRFKYYRVPERKQPMIIWR